jgi:DNA polymerase III delta prime subunit
MSFSESKSNIYPESENEFAYIFHNQYESEQSITFDHLNQVPFQNSFEQEQFFIPPNENVKEEENDDSRFFISKNKSKEITPNEEIHSEIKRVLFKTSKKNDISEKLLQNKTKRGRKTEPEGKPAMKIHEKTDIDNIITVAQISYINFIVDLFNDLLKQIGIQNKFIRISHKVKKNVKISNFENLKTKKLSDILLLEISPKFRSYDKDHNKKLLETIQDMDEIKDILNENYLTFFKEVYYKSERIICINGKNISLFGKKLKMYKNKIAEFKDEEYVEIFDKYVTDKYFGN